MGADGQFSTELGGGELGHLGGAVTTELVQVFHSRQRPAGGTGRVVGGGVQVGPVRGGGQDGHLGPVDCCLRVGCVGERLKGGELVNGSFKHVFDSI
ncbi:MAG: hypothetical protein ACR2KG_03355 [Nocardioidaceae bacterium]